MTGLVGPGATASGPTRLVRKSGSALSAVPDVHDGVVGARCIGNRADRGPRFNADDAAGAGHEVLLQHMNPVLAGPAGAQALCPVRAIGHRQ